MRERYMRPTSTSIGIICILHSIREIFHLCTLYLIGLLNNETF
jgi:hypothetical protein